MTRSIETETVLGGLSHVDAALPTPTPPAVRMARSRVRARQAQRPADRRMIAWDGEGINLAGDGQPQSYVLFGCSARVDDPLVLSRPEGTLDFFDIADYMLETKERFPNAYHIGFSFKYDQNMIIQTLRWSAKRELYLNGSTWVRRDKDTRYKVSWVPGKMIGITRVRGKGNDRKTTHIKIEDIFSFYATSFIRAYQSTFPDAGHEEGWREIVEGKASRGYNKWEDLAEIRRYWEYEIVALERLATGLRDILWNNGFNLTQWYGPGAFANYIRRTYNLIQHEWGGKEENLPSDALHYAIKCAYYGGHFEQYQGGRVRGKVYSYDINSAYPAAFTTLPTMREGGFWQELSYAECQKDAYAPKQPLTVYYVKFRGRDPEQHLFFQTKPMPLPWRDERGNVSYPPIVEGWYWSPEVSAILNSRRWNNRDSKLYIVKGYRWVPADDSKPWADVILPMYAKRLELKAANDPAQMAFKLGPNSLYGKMAQRVGYDDDAKTPPKAHTLCIAGYLTSWCRAQILRMLDVIDDDQLIAVETDGVYTTAPPDQITERWSNVRFSKDLGDWGVEEYDEVIYLQNGVYLKRNGDKWETKARGVSASALTYERVSHYTQQCAAKEKWEPLVIEQGQQFLGLGLSILRATDGNGNLNSSKANRLHCVWVPDVKEIIPTGAASSKRSHHPICCQACKDGLSLDDGLHTLHIHQRGHNGRGYVSYPYRLPWETKEVESWRYRVSDTTDRQSDVPRGSRRKHPHNRLALK